MSQEPGTAGNGGSTDRSAQEYYFQPSLFDETESGDELAQTDREIIDATLADDEGCFPIDRRGQFTLWEEEPFTEQSRHLSLPQNGEFAAIVIEALRLVGKPGEEPDPRKLETLTAGLRRYLASNGELRTRSSRLSPEALSIINGLLNGPVNFEEESYMNEGSSHPPDRDTVTTPNKPDSEAIIAAIAVIVGERSNHKALPIAIERAIARAAKRTRAVLEGKPAITVTEAPPAFKYGIASHHILAEIPKILDRRKDLHVAPVEVTTDPKRYLRIQQDNKGEKTKQPLLAFPEEIEEENMDFNKQQSIWLCTDELPSMLEEEDVLSWSSRVITESFDLLHNTNGGIPTTINGIRTLLTDDTPQRVALSHILQVMHVIMPSETRGILNLSVLESASGMNMFQIDISDKDDNDPFVYAVIDWLGIAQAYISMFKDYEAQDKKGVHFHQLSELPLGTITLQRSIEEATDSTTPSTVCVSGGIADVLLIREGHSSSAAVFNSADFITSPLTAPFDLAVDLAEKSFYSQAAMYRRHRRLPDGTLVETRTRPGRNTQAFLQGLLQYGGQSTLASAEITIIDHKLPYGDAGGYSVQLFPENEFTPAPEHITQMQRYVFFLYARLAWLDEWTKGRGDDFALSVDDIIRFADKYGYDRICGTIRYYSPQGTIPITIHPDSSMLYAIGNALLAEHDQERQTTAVTYHVLDALSLVLQEELRGLEKRNVPVRSVPETYKELCSRYEGKTYLGIAELEAALFERIPTSTQYGGTSETIQLKEGVSIIQAIELQSEKTRIMWLTGLDPEFPGRVFRIAFRNDRFSIQSDYGYVSGRLSSDISIIRDARKHMEHGIRSADEIRKQSRQTTQRDTVSSAFQSLWEQVSQIAPVVSRAEVIAENTVLDTDGSIRQLIDGKPLILRQDPFSGTWFLDITQLEKALADLSQQGETDIYHLSEIHRMVMAAQHRAESDYSGPTAGNCMCPHPAHRNTATPAGSFDAVQGRGHCHNGACGCNWILEGAAQLTPLTTLKPGLQVEDYRLVTDERNRAFEALFGFASCFTGLDSVGAKYLQSRGLQPGNILTGEQGDVGIWGYIPPEVATTIASAASSEVLSILRKHQGRGVYNAPFSEISGVLDRNNTLSSEVIAEIRDHVQQIAETVALYSDKPEEVLLKISFKTIAELAQRGIFGFRSYQGYEYERIGGRILVPTYWPINTVRAGKSSWGKANLNGRGVVIRGKRYYSSPEDDCSFRHIKGHEARPGKGGKRATPVGFWVVSPDHLEEEIQRQGRIVICEGFLNAASLGRLNPDLAPVTIAINGTGYRQIIALLQFLKEKGLPLDTVILEYDFDGPGAGAYQKNAAAITAHIKDITIQPVHTVLPEEIAVKLPPPDPVCFVSGGSHEGMKLDLNDLLRSEEIGAKYAFMSER